MRSLIELRRAGKNTIGTPSHLVMELIDITNAATKRKLMNCRITTLSDIMVFKESGNSWNRKLLDIFQILLDQLPAQCPIGRRSIRIGQYWASSNNEGQKGRII